MLWGVSPEPHCPSPPWHYYRSRDHRWLVTPSRVGTGAPGSPVQVLQTKHLNMELGQFSALAFSLNFHGFRDFMLSRGVGLSTLKHSSFRPVQASLHPQLSSKHTLGHQAAGCTTTSISIGLYTESSSLTCIPWLMLPSRQSSLLWQGSNHLSPAGHPPPASKVFELLGPRGFQLSPSASAAS